MEDKWRPLGRVLSHLIDRLEATGKVQANSSCAVTGWSCNVARANTAETCGGPNSAMFVHFIILAIYFIILYNS